MVDPQIVKEWLDKADEDFNFARVNLEEGKNFYAQICFHFQQSAEKYLKAFIITYDLEFEKMHNLIKLLKICANKESSLLSLMDKCETLNTAYIDTRYPVHWPTDYTKEKALKLQEAAEKNRSGNKKIIEGGRVCLTNIS
ncbi:MAG: HEPN domain-containing protein [Deltaproteobacteria bacterium]|nr:HEPN domain-containing protein [Deltaproteobacteria bacterium]